MPFDHVIHNCSSAETCPICKGAVYCTVCQGRDGDLSTDCPGRELTVAERNAIFDGDLDFKAGAWVRQNNRSGI